MNLDNSLYYGSDCIIDINNVVRKTLTKLQYLSKNKDVYAKLLNLGKPGSGDFFNVLTRQIYKLSDSDKSLLCDINNELFENKSASNKNTIINPFLEKLSPYSSPVFVIKALKTAAIYDKNWASPNLSKKNIRKIILKTCDIFYKLIKKEYTLEYDQMKVAYYTRAINSDTFIKVQFADVLTDRETMGRFLTLMRKYADKLKRYNLEIYVQRYNEIHNTCCYEGQMAWNYVELCTFSVDSEDDDSELEKDQNDIPNITHYLLANRTDGKQVCGKRITEFEEEEDIVNNDEYLRTLMDPDCWQFNHMISHLPDFYFENKLTEMFKTFNREEKYKIIFHNILKSRKLDNDFEKKWNHREYSEYRIEFFYRIALEHNGYERFNVTNDFKTDYDDFIVKKFIQLALINDGKMNDASLCKILNYMIVGKFYTSKDETKKVNSLCWYCYNNNVSTNKPKRLNKWKKSKSAPVELETYYLENKMVNILNAVISELDQEEEKGKETNRIMNELKKVRFNLGQEATINKLMNMFARRLNMGDLDEVIDAIPFIIGVHNGILDLGIEKGNILAIPRFHSGYSEYIVTKSANASFRQDVFDALIKVDWPDQCLHSGIEKVWTFLSDIIVERDALEFIITNCATMLDDKLNVGLILMIVGGGANGKSAIADNLYYIIAEYIAKLKSSLLRGDSKAGSADPELMKIKGKRGGILTETNPRDIMVSSRIKELTENTKTGRNLNEDEQDFESNVTIQMYSNYPLEVDVRDLGTWRRIMIYNTKRIFKDNPIGENERKVNREFEKIASNDQEFADTLFTLLVYFRVRLHNLYGDDIKQIKTPTLARETEIYKSEQDSITKFVNSNIVIRHGFDKTGTKVIDEEEIIKYYMEEDVEYSPILTLTDVVESYREWYKAIQGVPVKQSLDAIGKDFIDNGLLRRIYRKEDREVTFIGARVTGGKKLKKEFYLNNYN